MTKIEKLTPEQEAYLPVFREEWLKIGLSTDPVDRDASAAAVKRIYAAGGKAEPVVMHFDSPAACCIAINSMKSSLKAKLRSNLGVDLRGNLGVNFSRGNLWDNLRSNLWYNLRSNVWDNIWDNLWDSLCDNLGYKAFVSTPFNGGQEVYWIAWGLFAEHIGCKIDKSDHLHAYADYCKTSGWGYFYKGFAFVSDRPDLIVRNSNGRLSNDKGPAIRFRDGYSVYAFNGTNIPAEWITQRDTIDPAIILADKSVERRAAGLNAIGFARALDRLDWRVIDSEPNPEHGELIGIKFPGLPEEEWALKIECPRNKTIIEGVEKDKLEAHTVKAAQAYKAGIPLKLFNYATKRT